MFVGLFRLFGAADDLCCKRDRVHAAEGIAISSPFLPSRRSAAPAFRSWVRGSEARLRYGPLARWADVRAGRRDGRRGIVLVPEAGAGRTEVSTARIQELTGLTEQLIAREIMHHRRRRLQLQELRSRRMASLPAQTERTNQAEQLLAEAEKKDLAGLERLADARHPETYVRSRRLAQAERRREQASRAYAEEKSRLAQGQHHVLGVELGLQALDEVLKLGVRRAHAYGKRRISAYWSALVRNHPEGAEINDRCHPAFPPLPDPAAEREGNPWLG